MKKQMGFKIEQRDDLCILRISGRLASGADSEYMGTKAQEVKNLGCRKLIADISELDSIGSAGIGFFVGLHTSATKNGGCFVLVSPSPRVLEVLTLTGLSTVFAIAPDLAAGLALCALDATRVRPAGSYFG
ncbi:MAG TPA: STAS domain-containing protein [Bryobacteraceae bacterium]|nr:STAS domain-containing protein [Bryobacteraceae bacterium]